MKKAIALVCLWCAALLMSASDCRAEQGDDNRRLYDLNRKKELLMSQVLTDLKNKPVKSTITVLRKSIMTTGIIPGRPIAKFLNMPEISRFR